MSKFKLKETSVEVRGEKVRVRELTHGERLQWIRAVQEDRFRGPALIISLATLEPKMTEEEVSELPADVAQVLAEAAMKISNLIKDEAKKEPDAGGDVSVPSRSGVRSAT